MQSSNIPTENLIDHGAEFWLDQKLLPVTPHTLTIAASSNNESGNAVGGEPYTRYNWDKAQTFSISFMLPENFEVVKNEFWFFDNSEFKTFKDFTDYLWTQKRTREPSTLSIIYPFGITLNGNFMIDDYSYSQSAKEGSHFDFELKITEWYPASNKPRNAVVENPLVTQGLRDANRVS